MTLPSPDDMSRAPVWENYVVAQAVQASLGLIPGSAHAIGVRVSGTTVHLVMQLSRLTDEDEVDIDDIVTELELLLGDAVRVVRHHEIRQHRHIAPDDGVRWIFLAR